MTFFSRLFKSDKTGEEETFLPQGSYLNPYSTLGELDFYLIAEGRHERLWDVLGAHVNAKKMAPLLAPLSQYGHPMLKQ